MTQGRQRVSRAVHPLRQDPDPGARPKYQLFPDLAPAEFEALKADIAKRGVLIPVEVDEEGNMLDGHHRQRACAQLGIRCPTIARAFNSEADKREHVRKINLLRRSLDAVTWAEQFQAVLDERGVERKPGPKEDSATVALIASELGVGRRTAFNRLALLDAPEDVKEQVRSGEMAEKEARRRARKALWRAETVAAAEAIAAQPPGVPVNAFATIVIDAPWRYDPDLWIGVSCGVGMTC